MTWRKIVRGGAMGALCTVVMVVSACEGGGKETVTIADGTTVSLEYTLKLEDDSVVDSNVGADPLTYTHGKRQIIPGLEKGLLGMEVGESRQVVVPAEEGYGGVEATAIQEVPKEQLPPDTQHVGAQLQAQAPNGQTFQGRVTEVREETVKVDFNHPLAGKTLYFDVKVLDIQSPSAP